MRIRSVAMAGFAFSALLGIAGVTASSQPASAVIYCTYVGYPTGCVARAGVVLRAPALHRSRCGPQQGTVGYAGNANGGVNRVGGSPPAATGWRSLGWLIVPQRAA